MPQQPKLRGPEVAQQSDPNCVLISNRHEQGCGRGREGREVGICDLGGREWYRGRQDVEEEEGGAEK